MTQRGANHRNPRHLAVHSANRFIKRNRKQFRTSLPNQYSLRKREQQIKVTKFELSRLESYDNASLLSELRRVASVVSSPVLTRAEFDRHSKASASVICGRFGGWSKALSLAGLSDRYSGTAENARLIAHGARTFSDAELLSELHGIAAKLGVNSLTMPQFNRHATMNAETLRRRFGSWRKALERVGLTICNLGKRYSETDYFENLLKVWTQYGRQPTYGEMGRPPSLIRAKAYEAKWGRWRNALKAFLARVNNDVANSRETEASSSFQKPARASRAPSTRTNGKSPIETKLPRAISLGLRYDVMRRDHFRCVICGASPASMLGCELHVDHKNPVALGGKTVLDNLRTLCSECNIGKGAKVEI